MVNSSMVNNDMVSNDMVRALQSGLARVTAAVSQAV
jgi:hypothetical protein